VTAKNDALAQLNALLDDYPKVAEALKEEKDIYVEIRTMVGRFQAAVDRLTVPGSTYAQDMERLRVERGQEGDAWAWLRELAGIVTALRDDVQAGWLESVVELAHADTYNGYLEMGEGLVAQHYKDAAAVIA